MNLDNFGFVKLKDKTGKIIYLNPFAFAKVEDHGGYLTVKIPGEQDLKLPRNHADAVSIVELFENNLYEKTEPETVLPETAISDPTDAEIALILENNRIDRHENYYAVCSLDEKGNLVEYRLIRETVDGVVKIRCNCWKYLTEFGKDKLTSFRCVHILALKEFNSRAAKETEQPTSNDKPSDPVEQTVERLDAAADSNKWRCHHLMRKRIEDLVAAIAAHPATNSNMTEAAIYDQIRWRAKNKKAPQDLSQEAAERVAEWLDGRLADLQSKTEEEFPQAA